MDAYPALLLDVAEHLDLEFMAAEIATLPLRDLNRPCGTRRNRCVRFLWAASLRELPSGCSLTPVGSSLSLGRPRLEPGTLGLKGAHW